MGKRTSFKHGTFSWVDLACNDLQGAKSFYGELFGWSFQDNPAGENGIYSMAKFKDHSVCALFEQGEDLKSQGLPPRWQSYITVDDAKATVAKCKSLGGQVIAEPFDVMTFGVMAVIQDPTGGAVCLWQPKEHHGAEWVNDPGYFSWNELSTRELEQAKRFYSELLGWTYEESNAPMPYMGIKNGDRYNGGMMNMPPEVPAEVPPHWLVYFTVRGTDDYVKRAEAMGGKVLMAPTDIPAGRFAVLADPQGAAFAIIDPPEIDD